MNILALDPAQKTGWAHSSGASGVCDCSIKKDESSGMRLIKLRGFLNTFSESVDFIAYEAPRGFGYQRALVAFSKYVGVIEEWCSENEVEYKGYSSTQIKKFATGKGNASKEEMTQHAHFEWPEIEIIDDNHADALWLLCMVQEQLGEK